jgi:hypothetical protein
MIKNTHKVRLDRQTVGTRLNSEAVNVNSWRRKIFDFMLECKVETGADVGSFVRRVIETSIRSVARA